MGKLRLRETSLLNSEQVDSLLFAFDSCIFWGHFLLIPSSGRCSSLLSFTQSPSFSPILCPEPHRKKGIYMTHLAYLLIFTTAFLSELLASSPIFQVRQTRYKDMSPREWSETSNLCTLQGRQLYTVQAKWTICMHMLILVTFHQDYTHWK